MAESLGAAGYRTAAFASTNVHFEAGGLSRGFEVFDEAPLEKNELGELKKSRRYRAADRTIDRAVKWLAGVDGEEKLFLWIHLFDPHKGFRHPKRYFDEVEGMVAEYGESAHREFLQAAHGRVHIDEMYQRILHYDAEILFADHQLGRLYETLQKPGSRDLWILTSDHGQGLKSHSTNFGHAKEVYNTQVLVPFIWHFTDESLESRIIDQALVELVDLAPTLAEIVGFEFSQALEEVQGASLVPYLRGYRPSG